MIDDGDLRSWLALELEDDFDEELEQEIDDNRIPAALRAIKDEKKKESMSRGLYFRELLRLQGELVKLQDWVVGSGAKVVVLFEGRDSAGKGGVIKRITQRVNPRVARVVALPAPSDREKTQWYFQRYVPHLPAAGEMVLFDRSWYNRAGVEPVMGFCTAEETARFLSDAPRFEEALVRDGVKLIKFWLNIGRVTQLKRFHDRRHDPLKIWKLSPIDIKALDLFEAYTHARDEMLAATSTPIAPWTIIRMNDKWRGRLEVIRHVLRRFEYEGRDDSVIGMPDPAVVGLDPVALRGA